MGHAHMQTHVRSDMQSHERSGCSCDPGPERLRLQASLLTCVRMSGVMTEWCMKCCVRCVLSGEDDFAIVCRWLVRGAGSH